MTNPNWQRPFTNMRVTQPMQMPATRFNIFNCFSCYWLSKVPFNGLIELNDLTLTLYKNIVCFRTGWGWSDYAKFRFQWPTVITNFSGLWWLKKMLFCLLIERDIKRSMNSHFGDLKQLIIKHKLLTKSIT